MSNLHHTAFARGVAMSYDHFPLWALVAELALELTMGSSFVTSPQYGALL